MDIYNQIRSLEEKIQQSDGWKANNQLRLFTSSHNIFNGNYSELTQFLMFLNSPEVAVKIWSIDKREELNACHNEALRLFHNFLAAAKSLVDHTRGFVNKFYKNSTFRETYQTKIKETFSQNCLSHFIQDLRNYVLHKEIPITSATLHFGRDDGLTNTIYLNVDELRDWDGWTNYSKTHLGSLEDKVSLLSIAQDYFNLINEFYQWFYSHLSEIHKSEFEELKKLQDELRILYKQNGL